MNTYKVCYVDNNGVNNAIYVTASSEAEAKTIAIRQHPDCRKIISISLVEY